MTTNKILLCFLVKGFFVMATNNDCASHFDKTKYAMKMRAFKNDKLWRDKLVALCEGQGSIVHKKNLNDKEFDEQLRLKLLEEAEEVSKAVTKKEFIEELADVCEVIDTLRRLHGLDKQAITEAQTKKREARGGFDARAYVTIVEHPVGSKLEAYCLKDSLKYPEVQLTSKEND